jgi:NAD(P)-dependent dehydrogenase (short-subunit alcohol dehydrogenase family)
VADAIDPLSRFRLDGRTVILTGASSGLGRRFAAVLHAAGANVVAAARRADRLRAAISGLDRAVAVPCDVTVEADLERLVAAALSEFGALDILVNNAGTSEVVPAEDETSAQLRGVIDVNLVAAYRLTQMCAVPMLDRGAGAIVNVSSILGLVGAGQIPQASYAASKAGLIGLTRELAAQWARRGVRVNALAPGWFPSEMTAEMTTDPEQGLNWIRSRDPMGRPGREDELDGALLFLASDASSYVTGHTLAVDGGWTIV